MIRMGKSIRHKWAKQIITEIKNRSATGCSNVGLNSF